MSHSTEVRTHIAEIQLHFKRIQAAKDSAHLPYEKIRSLLPRVTSVESNKSDAAQRFILDRLMAPAPIPSIFKDIGHEVVPSTTLPTETLTSTHSPFKLGTPMEIPAAEENDGDNDDDDDDNDTRSVFERDGWGHSWIFKQSFPNSTESKIRIKKSKFRDDKYRYPKGSSSAVALSGGGMVKLPPWLKLDHDKDGHIDLCARGVSTQNRMTLDGECSTYDVEYGNHFKRELPISHSVLMGGAKIFTDAHFDSAILQLEKTCRSWLHKGCSAVHIFVSEHHLNLEFSTGASDNVKEKYDGITYTNRVSCGFAFQMG